jgi:hypothetical protein
MQSAAKTVAQYLKELPPDRREAIAAVREVILENLPKGYEEGMTYGMIGYFVPHRLYPAGYHCNPDQPLPFANLASQKNYMSLYMMAVYGKNEEWFHAEYKKTGKKLDMGKCCVRFKKLDDLPLELIGRTIAKIPVTEHIAMYEAAIGDRRPAAKKKAARPHQAKARKKVG